MACVGAWGVIISNTFFEGSDSLPQITQQLRDLSSTE